MVSFFQLSTQGPTWGHLDSGISTLNQMLDLKMDAILDIQSVPANASLFAMLANLMASHLSKPHTKVIVIETVNQFEWGWLEKHPQYQKSWVAEERISRYRLGSFIKLLSFFSCAPMEAPQPGSVLIVVLNFHEIVELYRLQLMACYEELLVKHQIEKNSTLLANSEKWKEEGLALVELPQLPRNSALLRENPYSRFKKHYNLLLLLISKCSYLKSAVVILQGFMEPKYKPFTQMRSPDPSSQAAALTETSFSLKHFTSSRLVFTPVSFNKELEKENESSYKISSRLILYKDWYFRSPHFKRENRLKERSDYRFVSVIKVVNFHGVQSINEPIYFNFQQDPFKRKVFSGSWFTNLLASIPFQEQLLEQANLTSLIQTSTQVLNRKRTYLSTDLGSSPPFTYSQLSLVDDSESRSKRESEGESEGESNTESESTCSDVRSVEIDVGAFEFEDLVINGSDVELTGTVFDDLEGLAEEMRNWTFAK